MKGTIFAVALNHRSQLDASGVFRTTTPSAAATAAPPERREKPHEQAIAG